MLFDKILIKFNANEFIEVSTFSWSILFYFIYSFVGLCWNLKKSNEKERDAQMRSQYIDPIENFSNKIDQL